MFVDELVVKLLIGCWIVIVEFCIVGLLVVWFIDWFGLFKYVVGVVVVYFNEVKV